MDDTPTTHSIIQQTIEVEHVHQFLIVDISTIDKKRFAVGANVNNEYAKALDEIFIEACINGYAEYSTIDNKNVFDQVLLTVNSALSDRSMEELSFESRSARGLHRHESFILIFMDIVAHVESIIKTHVPDYVMINERIMSDQYRNTKFYAIADFTTHGRFNKTKKLQLVLGLFNTTKDWKSYG